MKKRIVKAIDAADRLGAAGIAYLILSLIAAVFLAIAGFTSGFGGPNWALIGGAVGVAISGWLVQAFASAVAAYIDVAAALAYQDNVPMTPDER